MKTIKIMIAVSEPEMPILTKFIAEFHTTFALQRRPLKLDAKKFNGMSTSICTITGFASPEVVYYFGYHLKLKTDSKS